LQADIGTQARNVLHGNRRMKFVIDFRILMEGDRAVLSGRTDLGITFFFD